MAADMDRKSAAGFSRSTSKIALVLLVLCFAECVTGYSGKLNRNSKNKHKKISSCLSYGHSCWGAHGKRSDIEPAEKQQQEAILSNEARLALARILRGRTAFIENGGQPWRVAPNPWFRDNLTPPNHFYGNIVDNGDGQELNDVVEPVMDTNFESDLAMRHRNNGNDIGLNYFLKKPKID